jgi:hypothetical protein
MERSAGRSSGQNTAAVQRLQILNEGAAKNDD